MNETWFKFSSSETLHVCISGNGSRHILLLHGFAASLHTWDDLLPFFDPDMFTLHLIDLKGHGKSLKPVGGNYSPVHFARMINSYIECKGLRNLTLIGHSLGGAVSLIMALELTVITALVLIGAPAFPQKIPVFMRFLAIPFIGPAVTMAIPARFIAKGGLNSVFFNHQLITEHHLERYARFYQKVGNILGLARTVRQIIPTAHLGIIEKIKAITIPVLLIWGNNDRVVGKWQGEKLHALLPDSRLVVIPECGHNPHEEQPQNTFDIISNFLSSLDFKNNNRI
ncbi:MAG: hypothetical protein A2079_05525 [Geobacteraceae bacterium GWC2_48_7]|nr:MAG: hypothetical protein A2079_05525 [Geobacteraceae bacterium GWC2_48_7]